jgi:uncharacterized membrane protein YdjX (TVP38/TMEM64 family)
MAQSSKRRFNSKFKWVLVSCLVAMLIVVTKQFNVQELLHTSLIWVKSLGPLGPIAFMVIYNVATLLFIPGSLLTLKGGCLFGLFWGSVYVLIGATFGATFAFLIGRYLSRDWVSRQIASHPKFKAIDQAVKREGWKIVLLTRLSPIFPFNLLNYAFGVTQVSLRDYILGSFGMVPGTVMYVYIGSLATHVSAIGMSNQPISPETQLAQWVLRGVGFIATVAVTVYASCIAKKALDQSVSSGEVSHASSRNR